jgi:hypothetical protein
MQPVTIEVRRLKCTVITEAFAELGFVYSEENPNAQLVWWDGLPTVDPTSYRASQKVNSIPNMDRLCYKSTLFQALNQMQTLFPTYYHFFPRTLMLPHQFNQFQREHVRLSGKVDRLTWIIKPENRCCGVGIRLIQQPFDIVAESSPAVVQQYVAPYLIDGFKFDFRFYLLITDLQPLTLFIYREGIARFCTRKYHPPTRHNLSERFCHITNTAVNVENLVPQNENFTRPAREVIGAIYSEDLWQTIKIVSILTILALYPQIVQSVSDCPARKSGNTFDQLHRYFHILGIDILINEHGEPIVLELNDRPSMKVTFPFEHDLKKGLIVDTLKIICGAKCDSTDRWDKLLPIDEHHCLYRVLRTIQQRSLNVFGPRTPLQTPAKPIVYPKPAPARTKMIFRAYKRHLQ